MMDRRVLSSMLLVAALAAVPAYGEPRGVEESTPSASDALLDPVVRDSTEGIAIRPPVGAIINRQLGSGEVVRFVYPDKAWTIVLKSVPNSNHLPLAGNLATPGQQGLLDVAASQFTDRGGEPAKVLRREVVTVGPRPVGLIEAQDHAGIEPLFVQVALIPDKGRYFTLQMAVKGKSPEDPARQAFQRTLATVELLDRAALRKEQDERLTNTHWLWLQISEGQIVRVLQPVHFMRVVRGGRDVGYVQVNERTEKHHDHDGVYIVSRQHVELPPSVAAAPAAAPAVATPGINVPQPAAASAAAGPRELERDARFFVTFDRAHEDWISLDTFDHRGGTQLLEMGNNDLVTRIALDKVAAAQLQAHGGNKQPPTTRRATDTLQVDNYRGMTASSATVHLPVPPFYLPQALAQLLPRLLPVDQPSKYMFAFYVSGQRQLLYRYVDVGTEREVTLGGRRTRAVPITDRIGADGVVTTHYVDRVGNEWLGSVSDEGKLEVLPTDDATLQQTWPGFKVLPDPITQTEDDVRPRAPGEGPVRPPMGPPQSLPPRLDAGPFGGR